MEEGRKERRVKERTNELIHDPFPIFGVGECSRGKNN